MTRADPFIAKLGSLVELDDDGLRAAERLQRLTKHVDRRRTVIAEGEKPDFVYILLSGWAARYELRDDGSRRITGFLLPGDFCGIHAVCQARMDHSIIAITDCEVAHIPAAAMAEVMRERPTINMAIWRAKLIEEAILRKWLLFSTDAERSVAHLLCELYVRAAIIGQAANGELHLPITQEEIGDALRLTGVHVNRTLARLRGRGVLELAGRELKIVDREAMVKVARFDHAYLEPWLSENAVSMLG